MRKSITHIFSVLLFGCTVLLSSCNESDPLPLSMASFDVLNEGTLEKGIAVQFINKSSNASAYVWDYGDGTKDSLIAAPSHIYADAGDYDVTLTAYTDDGQKSSEIKSIKVKRRVLVGFTVTNISFVNYISETEFVPWDDDETGPDLVFVFGAQSDDLDNWLFTDTVQNLSPADFPLEWDFPQGQGMELNSETYELVLLDADPEKSGSDVDPYDVMFGITIDPVKYQFTAKDANDLGLLQVSIEGFAIDLFVTFSLQ
ncbi:MAG: PKD domain-containing protein [Cyclobacteriaceae bacterium]|nr:PKD domain-containing protein [Cyclobacteriaceae bacterium]